MMAQQTDPTLTAAVIAQTVELNNIHKKRKSTQEKIIAAEAAVTVSTRPRSLRREQDA